MTTVLARLPELSGGVWDIEYFGNTVADYTMAGIVLLASLAAFGLLQFLLLRKMAVFAEKTKTDIDDALVRIVQNLKPPFYTFVAFYVAVQTLMLHDLFGRVIDVILLVWVVWQVIRALEILTDYLARKFFDRDGDGEADAAISLLATMVRGALWVFGGLFILQNLGVNVTALIAGLGVGGVAIAFALQNILGDLFSSFAIYFDKPFQVGDFITVGDKSGTVEKIGIKTTRVRALQGEELVFSNQELTSAQVQNFGKMSERRIEFEFGVTYDTPPEKLRKIPGIIERMAGKLEIARFDRCFFKTYGDSALVFNAVYWVNSGDYMDFAKANHELFIYIMEAFAEADIEMAFPTRTVHVVNSSEGVGSRPAERGEPRPFGAGRE